MIKIQFVLVLILACGTFYFCEAQSGKREKKWQQAILSLEKSNFMLEYDKTCDEIEKQVAEFKRLEAGLRPEDVAAVRKAYEATALQFDKMLEDLKAQYSDPETREIIARNPDKYTRYMEVSLTDAANHYNNQCKQKMDELINYNRGAFGLMEVGILIQLSKELVELWQKQAENTKKMSADYFEREFTTQHRLTRWENY